MRHMQRFILMIMVIFLSNGLLIAQVEAEGAEKDVFSLVNIEGMDINIEPKTLEDGNFGFDFVLDYEKPIKKGKPGVASDEIELQLLSKGFIANKKENSNNSIITELRITGHMLSFGRDVNGSIEKTRKRRTRHIKVYGGIAQLKVALKEKYNKKYDKLEFGPFELANPENYPEDVKQDQDFQKLISLHEEQKRFDSELKFNRFITLDIHVKNEAEQGFDEYQNTVGAGFTTDLAVFTNNEKIAEILDIPFMILRSSSNPYKLQMPRVYVGYDYISDSEIEARKALTTEMDFSRLAFQAAWINSILDNIEVRITWQGYYEIDAPQGIRDANKDWTSFFEASAGIPLDKNGDKTVIVKYADGELPPTLDQNSAVSLGFSVLF